MKTKNIDYKLFFIIVALIVFGMIMISSVSVYSSYRITNLIAARWEIQEAYNYFYVLRNIISVIASFIIMAFVVKFNYQFFERYNKQIFGGSIFLILLLFIPWIGSNYNGSTWWIQLPWIPFDIQPSEFLKIWMIIFLASFFKKYYSYLSDLKKWFLPFIWILWWICLLLASLPDFWSIMVIWPIAVLMYFYAWMNIKHLLVMITLWFLLLFSVYSFWEYDKETGKNINKLGYITQRIDNFLAKNEDAIKNKTINDQTKQALIAIWNWGFGGKWFWGSIQKFWYLPEVQWDFIYSAIVEELWFLGGTLIVILYMYIGYRWLYIASRVKDKFWKFATIWVVWRILIQAFINIWVNLNIVPLTWLTLPFVSYGGSSLLSLMVWLWILLSISRDVDESNVEKRDRSKILMSI
jgi:cell division protein FtsW